MLVYQKTMFDRYYVILSLENFEKTLRKIHFCITIMARKKHEGFIGFENTCSRVKTYIILMSLNYVHVYAPYC